MRKLETCRYCNFWKKPPTVTETAGQCRRYPKRNGSFSFTFQKSACSTVATWPTTRATDWCGEHHPKRCNQLPKKESY